MSNFSVVNVIQAREPMDREPDVVLLVTASGSFADKQKLAHIKKDLPTQDFKCEDPFLRDQSQIQGEDFFLEISTIRSFYSSLTQKDSGSLV